MIDTWCQSSNQLLVDSTLTQCLEKHIFSATEFRDILKRVTKQAQLSSLSEEISIKERPIISRQTKEKLLHIEPEVRNLADYAELLEGEI